MRIPLVFVVGAQNVLQGRNAVENNSEDKDDVRKNSRRLTCSRLGRRRWFLSVTCYRSVAFAQACLQELQITVQSSENVFLPGCARFPSHVVLQVQRNGALK